MIFSRAAEKKTSSGALLVGVAVGVPLAIVVLVVVIAAFVVLCKKSADDRKHIEPMSPYYAGATPSMSWHFLTAIRCCYVL